MIQKEKIRMLAEERMNELNKGLFLVEITISGNNAIRVELDCGEGNVSIDDCISVSRNIEHNLDRDKEDFDLQVSSAGLDKPLRVLPQFKKNIGKQVKLILAEKNQSIEGKLTAV